MGSSLNAAVYSVVFLVLISERLDEHFPAHQGNPNSGRQMRQLSIEKQVPVGIYMSRPSSRRVTSETVILCVERNIPGSIWMV